MYDIFMNLLLQTCREKHFVTGNPLILKGCGSSGPHFNPLNSTHGDITAKIRHVGDYGNVLSDKNGNISASFTDSVSSLFGPYGIVGRTIVLHQLEDDLGRNNNNGSKTTGNAGARIACGVIGVQ